MGFYYGSSKRKLNSDGQEVALKAYVSESKLKSSDDFVLKDVEDTYLISKEEGEN